MLPVMFVLMLPSLIFGGLTNCGSSSQIILNNNAAIVQNMNDIAVAVNQILGEGITDAESQIAQDFAATSGDHYEIVMRSSIHMRLIEPATPIPLLPNTAQPRRRRGIPSP